MKKEQDTTSRASSTRSKTERPKVWTPPSSLDAPPAPDGFRHRWIRAESLGFSDTKNVSARLREGFELVRADEYPGTQYPVITDGKYAGVIGVGGQDEAVEHDLMKEQHKSMPINVDRQSRVTFGGTKKS